MAVTTFEKVTQLNLAFANPKGDKHNPDWDYIEGQVKLVIEEAEEMMQAVRDRNFTELMDAQGDMTTVNDGVAHKGGFDGNAVYNEVHRSNMSKLCANENEAMATIDYYVSLGIPRDHLFTAGDYPMVAIKVGKDSTFVQDGKEKFAPAGKFLKNISWREPDFDFIFID